MFTTGYACTLATRFSLSLAGGLKRLKARVDERLVVEGGELERNIYPDVRIVEDYRLKEGSEGAPGSAAAVAEPETVMVQLASEPARQPYIHIIDVRNRNQLITAIEFLSPSNKLPGNGREQYVQKQRETCEAGASLVEIDLVRAGHRATLAQANLSRRRDRTYPVCIYRAWQPRQCQVIAFL